MQGRLTIDLSALKANYRLIQSKVTKACEVAVMVKANAYGCGLAACATALEEAGAKHFFVASLNEALELRTIIDPECNVYVLGGFDAANGKLYVGENIIPVLNSPEQVSAYASAPLKFKDKRPAVLHFDTGMNRLGLDASPDTKILEALDLRFIMTHFVASDEKDHELNEGQATAFALIRKNFSGVPASLANSSGIFRNDAYHLDLVRPGMALYGLNPTPETTNPMRPVVALDVTILQTRTARAGETCGYNATYTFEKETALAIVAMGYADGFSRALSNNGKVFWNGKTCPIRGRVSMDLTIVEIDHIPESERPQAGDFLEVIGRHQDADALAADAKTIGYEILTSLSARYDTIYKD